MSIVRISHNKENPYVTLSKEIASDFSVSWAAKGLWFYLMGMPDHWNISVAHLSTLYQEKGGGRDAIWTILNELIEAGYCERFQNKNDSGQFNSYDYTILEFKNKVPHTDESNTVEKIIKKDKFKNKVPHTAQPGTVEPGTALYISKGLNIAKEKQQQKESKPKRPAKPAVVVFSCLKDLDINDQDKLWLTTNYEEATVEYAIKWATHPKTKINTSLIQVIKWACKNKPEMPKNKEDTLQKNRKIAIEAEVKFASKGKIIKWEISALTNYVEIVYMAGNGHIVIEYKESNFKEIFELSLKRCGFV